MAVARRRGERVTTSRVQVMMHDRGLRAATSLLGETCGTDGGARTGAALLGTAAFCRRLSRRSGSSPVRPLSCVQSVCICMGLVGARAYVVARASRVKHNAYEISCCRRPVCLPVVGGSLPACRREAIPLICRRSFASDARQQPEWRRTRCVFGSCAEHVQSAHIACQS